METIKNDRKRKKRKVGNKARAIRIGKRVEKLQLTRRSRGSEKKRGEIRGNRKADGDQRAIQRAKYSIPVWRRTIPLNFHRIRAIGGIPFYPWKEGTYIGPCRINPRPGASPIRDKNKQRRRKKAIHASFLTSTLDLSLSLSFCVGAPSVSHSFPLSHPCATASQRGVCSGSLTCCMLFCPGSSAILVFWTALYRPLILSATPERHPRNKKPYCSTLRNTVISVDRQSSKPLLLGTPGFFARTYMHTYIYIRTHSSLN